ncbi:Arrestin (or S-antigen), C-terminal domain [Rhizoctonia solani]|uniref:Arrestin (Or S-antigen), C-terminal domain n=1 Tax=Rhizoctonia solani TaxID=456999 RepID=A0A8H7M6A4_9AGAM|nr:Arrestin (or S-antigen), C-terminal domain [Rhizoctonia solani]
MLLPGGAKGSPGYSPCDGKRYPHIKTCQSDEDTEYFYITRGKSKDGVAEGIGARRTEVTEDVNVLSSSTVFFRAGHEDDAAPTSSARRAMSLGPGVGLDHEADDEAAISDDEDDADNTDEPRRANNLDQGTIRATRGRRLSADQDFFHRPPSIHGASGSQPTLPRPTAPHEVLSAPASHVPSTNVSSDASVKSLHENISEHPSDEEVGDHLPVLRRPSPSRRESSASFLGENEAQRAHDNPQISPPLTERQRSASRSTVSHPPATIQFPCSSLPTSPPADTSDLRLSSLRNTGSPSPHPSSLHPTFHTQTESPGAEASPVRDRDRSESRVRGRQNTRFSLAAVSSVLHEMGMKLPNHRPGAETDGFRENRSEFGLDVDPNVEADMWQEFKKGTYNYPISFAVPSNTPRLFIAIRLNFLPSQSCCSPNRNFCAETCGSYRGYTYQLPGEDDTEERENVVIERQWDEQLRYFITISGKSFPIGGTVPITLVMMPLAKVKIYRLTVMLEGGSNAQSNEAHTEARRLTEKIDYYAHGRRVARHDPTRRYELLSLKYPNLKHDKGVRLPLLPILDDSNNAISHSPLAGLIEGQDADEIATNLLNPNGPWTIQIMIRVERGDDSQMDKGKRKQFDIIVETPVHILSCNPDYTALPAYSLPSLPVQKIGTSVGGCLCNHVKAEQQNRLQIAAPSGIPTQSPISGLGYSAFNVPPADFIHPSPRRAQVSNPNTVAPDRIMGGMAVEAAIGHNASGFGERPQVTRAHDSDERITTLVNRSLQFERLVSGEEGTSGDMPPAYTDAVDGAYHGEERGRVMFSEV